MIERDGIEYDECTECGAEYPIDMLEGCMHCFSKVCPSCIEDHEIDCGAQHCQICGEVIEEDPRCPTCKIPLCESCFQEHSEKCKLEMDLGKQQRLITERVPCVFQG